jgi:hypothetical protein
MTEDVENLRRRLKKFDEERSGFVIHTAVFLIVNLLLWGIWFITRGSLGLPWPAVVTFGWGSGLAAHLIEYRAKHPNALAHLDARAAAQMEAVYGPDWTLIADDEDYQRIYKAVRHNAEQNRGFVIHLIVFILIILMIGMITQTLFSTLVPALILAALWGIGLGSHGATVLFDESRRVVDREQAIQQMLGHTEKKKKREDHARLVLADDGEVLEIIEDEENEEQRHV